MEDTPMTLLVAERDENTRTFLLDNLAADGYEPLGAQSEQETRLKLTGRRPGLLVIGRLDGERRPLALVRAIRSGEAGGDPCLPAILLGEGGGELELVRALEAGCDHFMSRPFSYVELRARVGACIRRAQEWRVPRRLVIGALVVDRDERKARHAGRELWLSRREFELLSHLAAQPTRVFTKSDLLRDVWGYRSQAKTRTVDAHACRLRKKLALAGAAHLIQNTRGVGYRLSLGPVPAPPEPRATAVSEDRHAT